MVPEAGEEPLDVFFEIREQVSPAANAASLLPTAFVLGW